MQTTWEGDLPDATQVVEALGLGVIIGAVVDLKHGLRAARQSKVAGGAAVMTEARILANL